MKAMVLKHIVDLSNNTAPLTLMDIQSPEPASNEILIKVTACGVCHTELDEIEGRTPPPALPVVPGHQVVGQVIKAGKSVADFQPGDRVGVAWIFSSCGACEFCRHHQENLCPEFRATGRDANGGYAELMTVPQTSAFKIPQRFSDSQA
ncbi:MAG: alcohol dehydrogenase catalytic domain-containing protein, partial [bacterium]|nr:alcohol dehydrogenase catalytic domain-containing protein [bacterium]